MTLGESLGEEVRRTVPARPPDAPGLKTLVDQTSGGQPRLRIAFGGPHASHESESASRWDHVLRGANLGAVTGMVFGMLIGSWLGITRGWISGGLGGAFWGTWIGVLGGGLSAWFYRGRSET